MARFKYGEVYIMKLLTRGVICKKDKTRYLAGFYNMSRDYLIIENIGLNIGT